MLKKSLLALSLVAPLVFQPVNARDAGQIYTECGLGAMIASGTKEKSTGDIIAIITNITWDLGTTALSSDITSPGTCARGSGAVAAYIHQSYEAIEQDLASGQGEHLDTLKVLNESGDGFESQLRNAFALSVASDDFASKTRDEKSRDLFMMVTAIN